MNVRDRLIEICRGSHSDYWGEVDPESWDNSADQILEEFWPIPKAYFDHGTLTDGTLIFELKAEEPCQCACCI